MAIKPFEDYLAEEQKKNDPIYQQKLAESNQALAAINSQYVQGQQAAVDKSIEAQTAIIEQQKAALPEAYRKLYDANAVQQLVGERQVAERMANLGLTDSGLNRTQQTALTLQRGNADADVRRQEREAAQKLEQQLLQIRTDAEAQKLQIAASANADLATRQYETQANLRNYYDTLAQNTATSRYNADVQAETERAKLAAQQAQQEVVSAGEKTAQGLQRYIDAANALGSYQATGQETDTQKREEARQKKLPYLYALLERGTINEDEFDYCAAMCGFTVDEVEQFMRQKYAEYEAQEDQAYALYTSAAARLRQAGRYSELGTGQAVGTGTDEVMYTPTDFNKAKANGRTKFTTYADYLTDFVNRNLA